MSEGDRFIGMEVPLKEQVRPIEDVPSLHGTVLEHFKGVSERRVPAPGEVTKEQFDCLVDLFFNTERYQIQTKDGLISFSGKRDMTPEEINEAVDEAQRGMAEWHKKYDAFTADDYLFELVGEVRKAIKMLQLPFDASPADINKARLDAFATLDFALMVIPRHLKPPYPKKEEDAETVQS